MEFENTKGADFGRIAEVAETGDWSFVDRNLNPDDERALEFATNVGPDHENPDMRGLAYTIWGSSKFDMPDEVKELALTEVRRWPIDEQDDSRFALWRASLALYKNGNQSQEVLAPMIRIPEIENDENMTKTLVEFVGKYRSREENE